MNNPLTEDWLTDAEFVLRVEISRGGSTKQGRTKQSIAKMIKNIKFAPRMMKRMTKKTFLK